MQFLLRAGLLGLCLVTTFAPCPGQCAPFSKKGLRPVTWRLGRTLDLGSIDAGAAAIRLRFEFDWTAGIALERIGHRGTRPDGKVSTFEYLTVPPNNAPRGLWQCVMRRLGTTRAVTVSPDGARKFSLWANSTSRPTSAVFRWEDVPVAGTKPIDWVEVRVQVPSRTPYRSEWSIRMLREPGSSTRDHFTIDEVKLPIVYSIQPGDANKTRLLIPVAQREPLPIANSSMRLWQLLGFHTSLEHPARGQQMQFSALYAGDPRSLPRGKEIYSPHRKILYFATEDTAGHYKRFEHGVVSDPRGAGYYRRAAVHFPEHLESAKKVCYSSPYLTVLSALQAKDDAFWFDVASHYREFVRTRMGIQPMRSSKYTGNRTAAEDSVVLATSNNPAHFKDLRDVFRTYVDAAEDLKAVFKNPETGRSSPVFMELQKWLLAPARANQSLIGPDFNPRKFTGAANAPFEPPKAAREQAARAHKLGTNVSVYTLPLMVDRAKWPTYKDSWLLRDRTLGPIPFLSGQRVDLGNKSVRGWFKDEFFADILDSVPGLGGIYLDTFGGSASFLRYPAKAGDLFDDEFHGGTAFVRESRKLLDDLRKLIADQSKNSKRHEDVPFLPTESVQEYLAGHYDTAQHGVKGLPLQTQLSNFADLLTSPTVGPVATTTNNPPLWNAVYHEYSRADALLPMLNVRGVASRLGGGQSGNKPGLDWNEWGNYHRMFPALLFAQGMKPSLFGYVYDAKSHALLVRRNKTVEVRDPSNRHQLQLLAFLQRLHTASARRAEAGQFLQHGVLERPLTLPNRKNNSLIASAVTQYDNPSFAVYQKTDELPGVTRNFYADTLTERIVYPVAAVFHSVWRSSPSATQLGLIFVNWTDAPAAWQATFDPHLYAGFGAKFRVAGLRPSGSKVSTFAVGNGNGATTLTWSTTGPGMRLRHHGTTTPGKMPPRSVQVFLIEPR